MVNHGKKVSGVSVISRNIEVVLYINEHSMCSIVDMTFVSVM